MLVIDRGVNSLEIQINRDWPGNAAGRCHGNDDAALTPLQVATYVIGVVSWSRENKHIPAAS